MTREEAIEILWQYDVNFEPHPAEKVMHAIDMAIEALSDRPTDEWCTDCKEYDHEKHCCPRFNRVIRTTLDELVRCKDCRQKHIGGSVTHYYWCDLWDREVDGDNYCSWGERREP